MKFRLPLILIAFGAVLSAQQDRFGNPSCSAPGEELASRQFFVLCHSSYLKVSVWTGYELKARNLIRTASRPSHFRHDWELAGPSAFDSDYRNSGFDRGHMTPAADFAFSVEAIRSTFVLSNAAPQDPHLNSGVWAQLENTVRRLAAHADVWVYTGPIFEGPDIETIGAHRVAVPTHFFKLFLVIEGHRKTMYAAIVPNRPDIKAPLDYFATTVREVERRTGLDFFAGLDDEEEHNLESSQSGSMAKPLP